jgi:type IV secretion system protein TrbG
MDTRRAMIAPRLAANAASLALLLATAAPVLVIPIHAEAQARRTTSSSQARPAAARRPAQPAQRQAARPAPARPAPAAATAPAPAVGPAAIRAANAEALAPSRSDGFVNAAQVFSFETGRVYEVWTAPMRITTITLEPGERITSKAAGDTERWMIGDTTSGEGAAQQVQILIKPFRASIATNMVVTTNRRMYLLSLRAAESTEAFNALVSWTYGGPMPGVGSPSGSTLGSVPAVVTPPGRQADIQSLNQNYRIRAGWWGRPDWTPVSVSDDGRQTFITFPASLGSTEAPPLFVISDGGGAQLVNWRKQGNVYVVDRLFERAELRLGGDHPRVVRIERRDLHDSVSSGAARPDSTRSETSRNRESR